MTLSSRLSYNFPKAKFLMSDFNELPTEDLMDKNGLVKFNMPLISTK